jgi:hypothetical protein
MTVSALGSKRAVGDKAGVSVVATVADPSVAPEEAALAAGRVIAPEAVADGFWAMTPRAENPSRLVRWAITEKTIKEPAVSTASATPTKGVHLAGLREPLIICPMV